MIVLQGINHKKQNRGKLQMKGNIRSLAATVVLCAGLVAAFAKPAGATTWCVNPGGKHGCLATIGAAVSAAAANDTINVAPGTYKEDVIIGKPLSLVGANPNGTIIDAPGLSNGVYIDGLDNSGLSNVVVIGIYGGERQLRGNPGHQCVGRHDLEQHCDVQRQEPRAGHSRLPRSAGVRDGEDFDCGEGIHLLGADHSVVANNLVANNGGGILLSDDTAAVHDNLVIGNISTITPSIAES